MLTRRGPHALVLASQLVLLGWPLGLAHPALAETRDRHGEERESLTAVLDSMVTHRAEQEGFSGSVLVSRNGDILLHKTYGPLVDGAEVEEPAYWIASTSKQFVGAAIALLAHEGKLDVDAEIGAYLEDVPADKRGITMRQLLTHTSGLAQAYASEGIVDREAAARAILETRLIGNPGDAYSYSNDGFSLLAILVEKAARQSFEDFVASRLLGTVGMPNTGFWGFENSQSIAPLQDPQRGVNQVHTIYQDGHSRPNWGYRGATGLFSTTTDLHSWISHLMKTASEPGHPLAAVISPSQFIREAEGIGSVYYGYGIAVVMREGTLEMISHIGDEDWLGHNSAVTAYADGDVIIVLSNHGYRDDGTPWSAAITRDTRKLLGK